MKKTCKSCRELRKKLRLLKQDAQALRQAALDYGTHLRSCPCSRDTDGETATCNCGFSMLAKFLETGQIDLAQVERHQGLAP